MRYKMILLMLMTMLGCRSQFNLYGTSDLVSRPLRLVVVPNQNDAVCSVLIHGYTQDRKKLQYILDPTILILEDNGDTLFNESLTLFEGPIDIQADHFEIRISNMGCETFEFEIDKGLGKMILLDCFLPKGTGRNAVYLIAE